MNTKDKARELVDEFANTNSINIAFLNAFEYIKEKKRAKQCALIAVDRIMKSGCTQPSGVAYYGDNEEATKYWQEVKKEINNV